MFVFSPRKMMMTNELSLNYIVFGEMTAWAVMCATVKPNQVQLPV